jgi:hypothetical protein
MAHHPTYYRLTESRDGFEEGTLFQLVARYGDWHPQDAKLEPVDEDESGTVSVSLEELYDDWTGVETPTPAAAGAPSAATA